MKLAICQYGVPKEKAKAIAKATSFVREAGKQGAELILLPELFEGPYFCQVEDYGNFKLAEEYVSSTTIAHFRDLAREENIVIPVSFFERAGNVYFNSLAMIDSGGECLGLYRKSHIPTGACYEEKFYFAPGNTGFKVFNTSVGKIGIGICWDQWFPETSRILALMGAELILFPTAIGSEPVLEKDSMPHWRNAMIGQAAANLVPVAASNRIGIEKVGDSSMTFGGFSFVSDQHGELLVAMNREEEGIRIIELDLPKINEERYSWGVFRDRRVDLYGGLLKQTLTDVAPEKKGHENGDGHQPDENREKVAGIEAGLFHRLNDSVEGQ